MNIDNFYSENSIDDWKLILGENLHYHAGSQSDKDIFEQAVKNLFCYIPKKSKILDCGCGWGGPAKLLINELECDVTGVTISEQQQKFIDQFVVYHADLNQYIPHEYYDIALFVESFCHLKQPEQVLHNFKNKVGITSGISLIIYTLSYISIPYLIIYFNLLRLKFVPWKNIFVSTILFGLFFIGPMSIPFLWIWLSSLIYMPSRIE